MKSTTILMTARKLAGPEGVVGAVGLGYEDFKSSQFSLTGACLGHRLCSISCIPGAGHLTLYRTFSDREGNGLWIRWGSSLNMAATQDKVPNRSQGFLHRGGTHLTRLQHGRTAGCATPLNSCSLCKCHLRFLFTQPR